MFGDAAARLGVRLLFVTDRCDQLDDPWCDGAIPVRFNDDAAPAEMILSSAAAAAVAGVLAVGDRPAVAAAHAARRLGLPHHPPEAARTARDKRLTRAALQRAGLAVPDVRVVARGADPRVLVDTLTLPVVVKPAMLSGSRGVIRANTAQEFVAAFERVSRLLDATDIREWRDDAASEILIESYIPGREYAVEGLMAHGTLYPLALFDKPDPLEGPYFEETLYVTPSRASHDCQAAIHRAIASAAHALGLWHGPVHAECRVNASGVYVLEVAARPIGGLCARALRFVHANGDTAGLEELLLGHALGASPDGWVRERDAAGVMMIPIPAGGVYRGVSGVDEALQVPQVTEVFITAKPDQQLVPLPEGASYLGFIFARADTPDRVEQALREAHARLRFTIARAVPMAAAAASGPAPPTDASIR